MEKVETIKKEVNIGGKNTLNKYPQWSELLQHTPNVKSEVEKIFEIEQFINFVVLLNEIEEENIKCKEQQNEN